MEWSYLCVFVLGLCCVAPVVWGQTNTSACLPEWYGTQCQSPCPYPSCLLNTCNRTTGRCLDCAQGYYDNGGTCGLCSSGCVNKQCNRETGTCSCQPGYHGDQCTSPCSFLSSGRCAQCSQDGTCTACFWNFMAPTCTDCAQGYYKQGTTCQQCSSGCVNNQCNRDTGTCSCLPGKYGDLCDQPCPPGNCLLNTCNQTTGRCLACNTGFSGDTCSDCASGYYKEQGGECQQCSSSCKDNKCDDNTGKCDGCPSGYHGDQCNSTCSSLSSRCTQCSQEGTCTACTGLFMTPSCTECVQGFLKHNTSTCLPCSAFCSTGGCDNSGNCNGGCVPGRYGDQCKSVCQSSNCLNNQCNKTSGLCLSCPTKYVGDLCQACQAGRWGGQCEKSCHVNCEPKTCDRYTGDCKGVDTSPKDEGSDQSHLAVVSGILGAGLMIAIAVLVFLCWRFRSELILQEADTLTSVSADPVTARSNAYTEPPSVALSPPDEVYGNTQHEIRDPGNPYDQLRVYSNMMFDREAHSEPEPYGTDVTTPKSTSEYVNVTLEHVYANMSSGPKTKKKPRKKKAK